MASQNFIQGKYILGSKSVVGDPRRKWEDRVFVGEVKRSDNSSLIIGIVADGVGSAEFGARGAQLAIDSVKSSLQSSHGDDIPSLIDTAISFANSVVFNENQKTDGDGLSTLVVTVIHNDRCFVGNVGDSRAYWIQMATQEKPGRVLQLTRDHSFYNIYGGDPNSLEAGFVVNAIGKKASVQVDCGFYLKKNENEKDDLEKAYQLGLAGLPLKPGDTILLCSDGLIKDSPAGTPYTKTGDILEAVQSEYLPDRAAIKLVSTAEGHKPDDNVSAVTIQYLSRELVNAMRLRSENAQKIRMLTRIGGIAIGFLAILLIGYLGYKASLRPTEVTILITSTSMPTLTATEAVPAGQAIIQNFDSSKSGNYFNGKVINNSDLLVSGTDWGIKIVIGETTGGNDIVYLMDNSGAKIKFSNLLVSPELQNGSIYVQPVEGGKAEVHFQKWPDIIASVSGSRMIIEQNRNSNEIWVYCFEGACRLDRGNDGLNIPVDSKQSYNAATGAKGLVLQMQDDEKWKWNIRCNNCIGDIISTPTASPTMTTFIDISQPTEKKKRTGEGANFTPTPLPPTATIRRTPIPISPTAKVWRTPTPIPTAIPTAIPTTIPTTVATPINTQATPKKQPTDTPSAP